MKLKRLVASMSASFDQFVRKVENHEAVASTLIDEVRMAAAKLKRQQSRNQQQLQRLQQQQQTLAADAERWQNRAKAIASTDEAQALACVQRFQQIETQQAQISEQIQTHEQLDAELRQRLQAVEARLGELQRRRTELSSRSAHNAAYAAGEAVQGFDIDGVFERWEDTVTTEEYLTDSVLPVIDPLDKTFTEKEQQARLEATLNDWLAETTPVANNADDQGETA